MPSGFFETLRLLLENYVSLAAFFCFLHICVVALIVREVLRIDDEIRGLRRWSSAGGAPKTSCAGVLHQFVEESRRWGPKGIFVPMTDFSDRLDSYVSGRVETLHSHVNLFLIVGVAGTFFAMFKFAVVAAKGGVDPKLLSRSLAEGVANAFPVGFVGLLLAVVGHWIAFSFEDRLRNAVNVATQTAMKMRQEGGMGIIERIGESLAPLANLADTLQGSLNPVIESFRSQLADTSKLIESQIQPLNSAIESFGGEVKRLTGATDALAVATRDLPVALKEAGELQREARDSMQGLAAVMSEGGTAIQAAAAGLGAASACLSAVPSEISGRLDEALIRLTATAERGAGRIASSYESEIAGLSRRSFESWTGACSQFVDRMNESTTAFCVAVGKHSEAASDGLTIAARQITEIGNQFQSQLTTSVAQLYSTSLEQLRPHLQRMDEAVSERYPQALQQIKEACDQTAELKRISGELPADYQRLSDSIRKAASDWERAVENARSQAARSPGSDDLKEIRTSLDSIERLLGRRLGQPFWKSWFQKNRAQL